jgi:hypothetical protein
MKEYMAALDAMSAHRCDNAFFDIKFGHNPFGITLSTPSDTFLRQVGARMHEKLIMTKAKQFSVGMAKYYYGKQHHNAPSSSDASNDITHSLPHNKMYVISYHETDHTNGRHTGSCTARLTGMNPSTQIHPVILSWLADN